MTNSMIKYNTIPATATKQFVFVVNPQDISDTDLESFYFSLEKLQKAYGLLDSYIHLINKSATIILLTDRQNTQIKLRVFKVLFSED